MNTKTPVSILQEMMVKQGMTPDYELTHDGGGRHVNTFTYRVTCDGLSASGTGRCKKEAKHQAAKAMLTEIVAHRNYPQLPAASTPAGSPSNSPFHSAPLLPKISTNVPFVNAVGELQELCADNELQEPEYILIQDVGPPHARVFTIRCKVSNFEEDGIATTKKQAKHDAAKRMVERIRSLTNEENSSNSSINIEMMNENAEERYRAVSKARKINLGIKLAEYHTKWKDSMEVDKRNKLLEQLEYIFPNEFFHNKDITSETIMNKITELENILVEIDVTLSLKDVISDSDYNIQLIELNTCPLITQLGMGKDKLEALWMALSQTVRSIKLFLS